MPDIRSEMLNSHARISSNSSNLFAPSTHPLTILFLQFIQISTYSSPLLATKIPYPDWFLQRETSGYVEAVRPPFKRREVERRETMFLFFFSFFFFFLTKVTFDSNWWMELRTLDSIFLFFFSLSPQDPDIEQWIFPLLQLPEKYLDRVTEKMERDGRRGFHPLWNMADLFRPISSFDFRFFPLVFA